MLRLATLMTGSVAVAEEVVQDAFVAIDERWDQVDRPGGYLRMTVVNGCRMALRRRELERRHAAEHAAGQASTYGSRDEIPGHLLELSDALDQLTERQRTVIVLRYFVDLPDREIAELLDCRPSTVRSLTRRALAALRTRLT